MRLLLLCLTALLLAPSFLHAQIIAVYGTFSPVHASNVEVGFVGSSEQTTSFWASGVGGGITLNVLQLPLVKIGLDLRGSTRPGTPGIDTALFGIKAAFKAPAIHLKPYVQASGGYIALRNRNVTPGADATFLSQDPMYEILGGLDYPLLRILDNRLIEIGAGKAYDGGLSFSGTGRYNPTIFTVNTGVVVHF